MPIHDWSRIHEGAFHNFHVLWIGDLVRALEGGLLPGGYYAMAEQVIGGAVPDVLTLGLTSSQPLDVPDSDVGLDASPAATITAVAEAPVYQPPHRVIAVRHRSHDRLVALMEIISAGNKRDAGAMRNLVEKTVVLLSKHVHVMLIDLHPRGTFDPEGIHNLIWAELGQNPIVLPQDRPFLLMSYLSSGRVKSFLEPRALGEKLPDMPLFLTRSRHVSVPLEATYQSAFAAVPPHLRRLLESR
jgi:hypothetical protein